MAYGLKYFGEVGDYYDDVYRVEIEEDDYTGEAAEMVMSGQGPLILSYPGDEFDVFRPIYGSQLSITVISTTSLQYIEMHTADARKYKVTVYKNTVEFWIGWILPDLFTEPYTAAPYPVTLTARCGLGELSSVQVPETVMSYGDGETPALKSYVNLYSVFCAALNHINTGLDIHEAINIYNAERTTEPEDTDTTLTDVYIDLGQYQENTYYDLLTDAMRVFGARLYQQEGAWWMVRVKEYNDLIRYRILTTTGGSITFDTKITNTYYIGRNYTGSRIINSGAELKINPAWKQFEIITKRDLREGVLDNPKFEQTEVVKYVVEIEGEEGPEYLDYYFRVPLFWQQTAVAEGVFPMSYINIDNSGTYVFNDASGNFVNRIYQSKSLVESENQGIYFSVSAYLIAGIASTDQFAIRIKCQDDLYTYYAILPEDPTEPLEWAVGETNIVLTGVPVNSQNVATAQKYEFMVTTLPVTGTYEISIFAAKESLLVVTETETKLRIVEYLGDDPTFPTVSEDPEENSELITINENNSYIPPPIEVSGGDLPDIPNAELIYQYGYRTLTRERTRVWSEYDEVPQLPLLTHLGNAYTAMYGTPQWVLTMPILSDGIQFDSNIVDLEVNTKKYLTVSADWDLAAGVFSGTFAESDTAEVGSEWLLAGGVWNDLGIWLDDEEWED
jgi:hypothetical protein